MEDADVVANQLSVPESEKPAFAELYNMRLLSQPGQQPSMHRWKEELRDKPAQVQVQAFINEHDEDITQFVESNGLERSKFDQLMSFTAIYGKTENGITLPMNDALKRVKNDILSARENPEPKTSPLSFDVSCFKRVSHMPIRMAAFPYRPASCTSDGDLTVDCKTSDGALVGYIGFNSGGYIDDLAVLPAWGGRGIAKRLVCSAAKYLQEKGKEDISLHVRAANYPAIGVYKSLNFSMTENIFPGWYDWHGGYEMCANTKDVAGQMR